MPATADRIAMRYREEATFGTAETGNTFKDLRLTGESLRQETQTTTSQELEDDRQVTDVIRTGVSAAGDINFEMSYGAYDDLLQAALLSSAWSSDVDIAAGTDVAFLSASSGEQGITKTAGGFNSFSANQWVRIKGATTASNNGLFKIKTVSSDTSITVYNPNGSAESAGASVSFKQGGQIVNGTTLKTFNIEKEFAELTGGAKFELLLGMAVNSAGLTVNADAIQTGAFSFVGKSAESKSATTGDGSPTAAPTNSVMNAIDHVQAIYEGSNARENATQLAFTLENNLRARLQIGTLGAVSIGEGHVGITGTVQQFYETADLIDKHLNMTETSLAYAIEDGAGNGYIIEFPAIKFTAGQRVAGGIDSDILADMQFTAYKDSTEGITIRIQRFAA